MRRSSGGKFAPWFRRTRKAMGYDQKTMAVELKISQGSISKIERGLVDPSAPVLVYALKYAQKNRLSLRGVL